LRRVAVAVVLVMWGSIVVGLPGRAVALAVESEIWLEGAPPTPVGLLQLTLRYDPGVLTPIASGDGGFVVTIPPGARVPIAQAGPGDPGDPTDLALVLIYTPALVEGGSLALIPFEHDEQAGELVSVLLDSLMATDIFGTSIDDLPPIVITTPEPDRALLGVPALLILRWLAWRRRRDRDTRDHDLGGTHDSEDTLLGTPWAAR
jgi:hypothetical protein